MSDQNFVTALGTTLWNTGLNFGDTVWTGVSEVADATGGFISEEYNAFTDTAYEIITTPVRAAETVTQAAADAAATVAGGAADATRAAGDATGDLLDNMRKSILYTPPLIIGALGVGLFVAYKQGLFK